MKTIRIGASTEEAIEFEGEQIVSSDWKIESLDLTGFVQVYLTQDGKLITYSEQRDVDDTIGDSIEKNFHITLVSEIEATKKRGNFAKLIFGDQLLYIRNEIRRAMPKEMESNDIIKLLAVEIARKLDLSFGNSISATAI